MIQGNKPIFYDQKHWRLRYSRRAFIALSVFILAIFGVTLVSVIKSPDLPKLVLTDPEPKYRGVANVPKDAATPSVNFQPAATTSQSSSSAKNKTPDSSGSKSKIIGFYVNWDDNSLTSLKNNIGKIDELMPEWLHLQDGDGNILVDDQARQDETLAFIKSARPELPIAPLVNNYNPNTQQWDQASLSAMLSNPAARAAFVQNVTMYVWKNNFSGISIDFEAVPDNQQANLLRLMQELYAKLHPIGLEVSQNIPLSDPSFDAAALSKTSDFLILMAYDENSIGDNTAGPIVSQNWFISGLKRDLAQVPADKYVIALGGYGYDWEGATVQGTDLTFQDAMQKAGNAQAAVALEAKSLNPTFDYLDNNGKLHHIWFLDGVTVFNEITASQQLGNFAGYALWRLGSEDPTIWDVFNSRTNLNQSAANYLKNLQYGYDIHYDGQGEVLRATSEPQNGQREIIRDPQSGLIISEKINKFPSPFIITRWGADNSKKIALTFDDGPDSTYTPKILDILKRYKVPATFFVVGMNASFRPDIVDREFEDGNEIGNHTYTHPNIATISNEQLALELSTTERLFEGLLGHKSLLFRPPYAEDVEPATPEQVKPITATNKFGYYTISMHIDPKDWKSPGADNIVNDILAQANAGLGNIVLLHDGGGNRQQTIEALPRIIETLQANGYQLVTVSALLGLSRDSVMPVGSLHNQIIARLNALSFLLIYWFGSFIRIMFLIGIILGIARLLFVVTLAIIQRIHSSYATRKLTALNFRPSVSVIIPAYNEVQVVVKTVNSILSSDYQNYDIIVIDDGSKDATLATLRTAFGENPKVNILTQKNQGKAAALNFGIAQTKADVIVTLDADTLFRPDTIPRLARHFVDRRLGAVAGNAKVGNRINLLTRWQALEYITSQNLDRRAFEIINCITVVPGSVGAWRRSAILQTGGFSKNTLAEDADLTFGILRQGYRIAYEDRALGFTEAPDSVHAFIKQRFRWMYGMQQTAWKHRDTLLRKRYGFLGFFSVPNVLIFQVFFPLISPLMDILLVLSIGWAAWQHLSHPLDISSWYIFKRVLFYYVFFTVLDFLAGLIPFFLEHREDWRLLIWLPLQRFYYRQLMYYVAIKAISSAIRGKVVSWGKVERKATATTAVPDT